jgi:hypothetical protein
MMRWCVVFFGSWVSCFGLAQRNGLAGNFRAPSASRPGSPAARLEISSDVSRVAIGAPLGLHVRLLNRGPREITVIRRMAWGSASTAKAGFELEMTLTDPRTGRVYSYSCPAEFVLPASRDIVTLRVGESVQRDVRIDDCWPITNPGLYVLLARYRDRSEMRDPKRLTGEVVSNRLVIEYVRAP